MQCNHIWMDGRLMPANEAQMSFMTPALHYGIAAFEGIRCYDTERGPGIFRLRDHIRRLLASASVVGWRDIPWTLEELMEACRTTVRANGFAECYIRPVIWLADGGWDLCIDHGKPRCAISVWEWGNYLGEEAAERGVRANVSSYTRHHPNATMTKAKISGNYVNSVLAKTESVRLGFDEAIMLDPQGLVAECTGENIFIVKDGRISTPSSSMVLAGLTRDAVMTLSDELGYEVSQEPITRDQLYMADEVFVTGTAAEVIAIREIDFRVVGTGRMGPITRALQQGYREAVRGRHPLSARWVSMVERDGGRPAAHRMVSMPAAEER